MTPPLEDQIVDTIRSYVTEHGYPPSYAEIADDLGVAVGTVHKYVGRLVDAGVLARDPVRARTLRIREDT